MLNFYLESVSNKEKTNDVKGYSYFIDTDINDRGTATIHISIRDKHFHYAELVNNLSIVLNAVKMSYSNLADDDIYDEVYDDEYSESYIIENDPDESCIRITIFKPDFDVDCLLQNATYSLGYLQGCMLACSATQKGGE